MGNNGLSCLEGGRGSAALSARRSSRTQPSRAAIAALVCPSIFHTATDRYVSSPRRSSRRRHASATRAAISGVGSDPRSTAPCPSPPTPASHDADQWPGARGSNDSRRSAPGRCSSAAGPPWCSTRTSPASSTGAPSGSASAHSSPTALAVSGEGESAEVYATGLNEEGSGAEAGAARATTGSTGLGQPNLASLAALFLGRAPSRTWKPRWLPC